MVEVMALGCPLVVTANVATLEYAVNKESALFFEAGDVDGLTECIRLVLDDANLADRLGEEARRQAKGLAERRVVAFLGVLERYDSFRFDRRVTTA